MLFGVHAGGLGLLALGLDVDLAGRILAHQHHRKAGLHPVQGLQLGHVLGDALAEPRSKSLAVDDARFGHVTSRVPPPRKGPRRLWQPTAPAKRGEVGIKKAGRATRLSNSPCGSDHMW